MAAATFTLLSCEKQGQISETPTDVEVEQTEETTDEDTVSVDIPLDDVALLISELQIGTEQVREVYMAVTSSSFNGYDEEYMMIDLFREPGAGVGDDQISSSAAVKKSQMLASRGIATKSTYSNPLKDLITERLQERQSCVSTAHGSLVDVSAEEYLAALQSSDIQIYWPYSEDWDGETLPIITYDPDDGSVSNIGYQISYDDDGQAVVEEVIVTETVAQSQPVWVINRNDDSEYTSLELLRMQEDDWGSGGEVIIGSSKAMTKSSSCSTLILRDFTMLRNYDAWFAGASEFFVKIGAVEDFTASTESEMYVYDPTITDFMVVVQRKYLNVPVSFNAVLVSEWTDQLDSCALMILEYDGGTVTTWKCSATVKINSKSYGFEISIPFNSRDDIVWRGSLSAKYLNAVSGEVGHFGDVDMTFEIVEY